MSKQIIIAEEHRIAAVFSEDQIQELIVATGTHQVGDVYLGVVENVLPSIDAAFVNIGDTDRNGFIHVSDLGPLRLKKTAGSITELLAPQQKVLVQVMKEPTGTKGPRLTGNISLPGRYMVLMPYGRGVNLSRRIRNENERNRLRALAILIKPAGMAMVVRTEAEGVSEEAIIEDLESLQKQWESIHEEALCTRAPALLNRDDDFIQKVLRDVYNADVNRIVVDSSGGLKRVKQHLTNWGGGRLPQGVLVDQHRERIPILDYFRVNAAIREALKPRVDLPSGGYIIIEKTEALTVIDVNSGSFTRSQTSRETVLWTNCEAATEIARQLRLRNIAGVIVVDFIDMDSRRDQQQVLEHFNRALQTDKAKPQIAQLTELGLVELTRKRQGKNIYELFGQTCSACAGLGSVARLPGESEHRQIEPGFERFPEARDSRRPELRREASAPAADELGPDADVDLELMHHPSYQERGARGARGGRRRRRGELAFAKEPVPTRSGPWEEEGRYGNGSARSTTVAAPTFAASADRASVEAPAAGFSQEPRELAREEREPRRSRRERPPAEPPELVHVEMSAAEQEVYAWMGISPLVLSTQEVKNPKNTLIAVTLPGEDVPPSLQAMANQPRPLSPRASRRGGVEPSLEDLEGAEAPVAEADPSPDSREPKAAPRRILTRRQRQAAPLDLPIAEVPLSEPPEPTSVAVAESDAEVDNELAPRRRRRRSSASR